LRDQLDWVTRRRWFGDKARQVTDLHVVVSDTVFIGDVTLMLNVVRFTFDWGQESTYFIPLLEGDGPVADRDAAENPDVLRRLVEGFSEGRELQGEGIWRWRVIGDKFPSLDGLNYDTVRPISGEQSITSIIFDGRLIGKV